MKAPYHYLVVDVFGWASAAGLTAALAKHKRVTQHEGRKAKKRGPDHGYPVVIYRVAGPHDRQYPLNYYRPELPQDEWEVVFDGYSTAEDENRQIEIPEVTNV